MPALQPGSREPIARGNTSTIIAWSPTTVAKVLRAGIPDHWAAIEADITRRVHDAGLPAPATDGVVEVDGRPAVILEHVPGPTMWERMKAAPGRMRGFAADLVSLQTELLATSVRGLPDLARRLGSKIDEAVQVSAGERQEAQRLLASMPIGVALCHGDCHPANIVLTDRGLVILDWFDAAIGQSTADRARSSILMRPLEHPPGPPVHLDGATTELVDRLHAAYLSVLVERGLLEGDFARWEAIVAVGRMSEPVPSDDLVAMWRRWRASGDLGTERMVERALEMDRQPSPSPVVGTQG
jgi:aminoglycoside phosphotransferase (APT) family kinase protein